MNKIVSVILLNAFCLFFAFKTNAQQFKIIAAEDGAALPFATLINYTHPNFVSANENGIADITLQIGDSIAVSYVGYKTTSFIFNSNTSTNIHLFKEKNVLPAITVMECKKMKELTYDNKNAPNYRIMGDGKRANISFGWWVKILQESFNPKWAVRLNPEKDNAILKSFSFWLKKNWSGPMSAIKTPLIVTFHDVTDSILPGNELIETPFFYYPQKEGEQTLNLDSLHIIIPPKGIYVSIQIVMNDAYAWSLKVKRQDSNDTVITAYGGDIVGAITKDFELAGFNPIKNNWYLLSKTTEENKLHTSIKCEAVLKYCVD